MPETPTDTGTQYAGPTADERLLAEANPHLRWCDAPSIDKCPNCQLQVDRIGHILEVLRSAGRLLPDGGETRTEWAVWWHAVNGADPHGIRMSRHRIGSRAEADQLGPERIGQYGITRFTVHRREHRIFADGSSWTGPWAEVGP